MKNNIILAIILVIVKYLCKQLNKFFSIIYNQNIMANIRSKFRKFTDYNSQDQSTLTTKLYTFRPYELIKVDYKNYNSTSYLGGRGINQYPKPRSGHRIVCDNTNLYCFGGFNPEVDPRLFRTQYLFQELWKFNLLTKKWVKVFGQNHENMPDELASNAIVWKDELIIIFGGTGYPFGAACSNKCYLFWPKRQPKSIELMETTGDKPQPQYGQAMVYTENYLYVIGGTSGYDYSCDIYRLNLVTKHWECIYICRNDIRQDEDPKGRYRHEVAFDGNNIYILGGGTSHDAYNLDELPTFCLTTRKWKFIKTKPDSTLSNNDDDNNKLGYPAARKCHSCVQHTNDMGDIEIIVTGGYHDNRRYFNDIWKLNLKTFQWRLMKMAKFSNSLYFHDAATAGNGLMYIFGGIEVQSITSNTIRTNDVHKMWITIPKLSEMCWEAVLHYQPKLQTLDKNLLLQFGIPKSFVNRIE